MLQRAGHISTAAGERRWKRSVGAAEHGLSGLPECRMMRANAASQGVASSLKVL